MWFDGWKRGPEGNLGLIECEDRAEEVGQIGNSPVFP